jgi:ribonuclease BN (tRNA processing enzyme)
MPNHLEFTLKTETERVKTSSHGWRAGEVQVVRIEFLGSGNAFCPPGRLHSLVLIDRNLLVDAPPTLIPQLRRAELSPASIRALLITHWHADHIFGFPFLLLDRRYISDREGEAELSVHLHSGGVERLSQLCDLAFPGSLQEMLEERVAFNVQERGRVSGVEGWMYERFPVCHVPETEPHGYDLQHESGLRLIHCGDSGPCDEIARRSEEADVVIIELGLPDHVESPYHFRPSTLSALADACPQTKFLATHHYESDPSEEGSGSLPKLPDNVIQVSDGMIFNWNGGDLSQD